MARDPAHFLIQVDEVVSTYDMRRYAIKSHFTFILIINKIC